MRKIPLAWLQLKREKTRLLVALAGIGFADMLMFLQLGFRSALFDSAAAFNRSIQGDIVLINAQSVSLISMEEFSERRLNQTLGFTGVKSISHIYLGFAKWKNPQTHKTRNIFVIGFNPTDKIVDLPGVQPNLDKLKMPDVVLFDRGSRSPYGPVRDELNQNKVVMTEVKDRQITVGGLFTLGPSFGADGNLITSDLNFLRIFTNRTKGLIDLGVIKLKPGVNTEQVLKVLRASLPKDVLVLSKQEYVDFEKSYWNSSTPIGFIFTLGAAVGFIVGAVIVYQILYSEVSDHLPEYATLKAMGYKDIYLLGVVFQEAFILAVLGYVPGFTISFCLYVLTKNATLLTMFMTVSRGCTVLILTILMCSISGAIAVRKIRSADPADIF